MNKYKYQFMKKEYYYTPLGAAIPFLFAGLFMILCSVVADMSFVGVLWTLIVGLGCMSFSIFNMIYVILRRSVIREFQRIFGVNYEFDKLKKLGKKLPDKNFELWNRECKRARDTIVNRLKELALDVHNSPEGTPLDVILDRKGKFHRAHAIASCLKFEVSGKIRDYVNN